MLPFIQDKIVGTSVFQSPKATKNGDKYQLTAGDEVLMHVVLSVHAERHARGGRGPALHLRQMYMC